ncbi:MAG: primosomal protein N' [Lachnospiraceae bacterium]|nr:primosomal protein N' [Lachnospiraceae bacterium]
MFADVIIDISIEKLDRTFQYRVPEALKDKVYPGAMVKIPFGKGSRKIKGYVLSLSETPVIDESLIKDIEEVPELTGESGAEEQLIRTAFWMKEHYGGTLSQSLKVVFPIKKSVKEKKTVNIVPLVKPEELKKAAEEFGAKHNTARERVLTAISESGEIDASLLMSKLNVSRKVLEDLSDRGFIKLEVLREYRNPGMKSGKTGGVLSLSPEQKEIYDEFVKDYEAGIRKPFLIRGITGSGKTLVYIEIIDYVISKGKQAIMLIPEIALTFQTVMRFHERFGNRVSYMHSRLSAGERYDQYERAKAGDIDVMIGPRSALFTPFKNLGVIIIDEEHENSYKAENMPKYHARETALQRAEIAGASVVLGSATPSVESEYRARNGEFRLFTLKNRPGGGALAGVSVIDLREELREGNRSMFSGKLRELMEDRLNKDEQIMLFLNRRGFAGFISCRKCGKVIKCPHCDVSLTSHRDGYLTCHYCGFREKTVTECPSCGSKYIGGMRAGTEQLEEQTAKLFPKARILRMDGDTTKNKGDYEEILSQFKDHSADILIGTQMIVKGHDFPLVTLVGIIAADMSLYASDFRASERTFDLLTQAAGRAGRSERKGEVVIQTYSPDNYCIETAAEQDYEGFYEKEIVYRSLLSYPPVSHLLKILIEGKDEEKVRGEAEHLADLLKKDYSFLSGEAEGGSVIGPAPDVISKLRDVYRYVFFVRDRDYEKLVDAREKIENDRRSGSRYDTQVTFDFDPM